MRTLLAAAVASIAACGALTACAPSTPAVAGGDSPGDAAVRYLEAELRDDTGTQNRLTATQRTDCPHLSGGYLDAVAVAIPSSGEKLVPHTSRVGRTWNVIVEETDSDTYSSGSPVTVVRYRNRYFVC